MKLDSLLSRKKLLAIKAAQEAGKVLINNFNKNTKFKSKGDRSFVSSVDLMAEGKIVKLIKESYPDDDILSEEKRYRIKTYI